MAHGAAQFIRFGGTEATTNSSKSRASGIRPWVRRVSSRYPSSTRPAGSFGSSSSLPYGGIGYSQISIGGSASTLGVLGIAIFDPHNATQNDDTLTDFQGLRLGIFLHTIADAGLGSAQSTAFRAAPARIKGCRSCRLNPSSRRSRTFCRTYSGAIPPN